MRVTHILTDTFICKYYNNNVNNKEVIKVFPDNLYSIVVSKINGYNESKNNLLNYDQYTYWLDQFLNDNYKNDITKFKEAIKRIK
ncbi:MAG: hypothetical protein E6R13_05465 [Spirochaetes bacterium]|nr:MAG: hypothetical protein E6R13_05465 [Spirochaetota bacterium]